MYGITRSKTNESGGMRRPPAGRDGMGMKRWLCLCLLPVCGVAEEQDCLTVTVGHVLVSMKALPVYREDSNLDGLRLVQ